MGEWKWYNIDGTIKNKFLFKEEIQRWPNGKWKVTGGYFFNEFKKVWLKVGEWKFYDEKNKLIEKKYYDFGDEIK